MINFAKLFLSPGQSTVLFGLFETDWDYGRAVHFVAPAAFAQREFSPGSPETAPTILWQQGIVSAADVAISADWGFQLYNQGTITNRLFLTLAEAGQVADGRYAITGSAYADGVHNAGRIDGALHLNDGNDLLDGRLGIILGAIHGGSGDDTLLSGAAAETLLGGDGRDWMDGGAGADSLLGGAGDNLLFAGTGNDSLTGEDGHDEMHGEAGDDWLVGDRGNDSLAGGDGADTLVGGDGDDTLEGGDGDDLLEAWDDRDQVSGGAGNDTIIAWGGDDALSGGAGDDVILTGTTNLQDILSLFSV